MKTFKIKIINASDPAYSTAVQQRLFTLGIFWVSEPIKVRQSAITSDHLIIKHNALFWGDAECPGDLIDLTDLYRRDIINQLRK